MLGGIPAPRRLSFHISKVFLLCCVSVFLLYEGWQYLISVGVPVDRQTVEWEEAVRRSLGATMCSSRQSPASKFPTNLLGNLLRSRKSGYIEFDAERAAQLRMTIPEACMMFLIGTAGAIEAHCPAKQTLSPSLYYCRL